MEDTETVKELVRCMKKQNIAIHVATKIAALKVHPSARGCTLTLSDGTEHTCEVVLYAIGRQPVTKDLNLAGVGMVPDPRGYIPVDAHYKTSVSHIFAVGDVISTPALAHTASAEALHAVEVIAGHTPPVIDYYANPSAIYTFPEIASIGLTEEALQSKGTAYKVAKFPFAPMAKAKIEDATEGFIKILFEPTFRDILGVHIVGSKATELIGEFVLGKILETTLDEIGHAIHPHPTLSETIMEAAHAGLGGAIHM
jgi:dihydrolipoamide dehydrogenase